MLIGRARVLPRLLLALGASLPVGHIAWPQGSGGICGDAVILSSFGQRPEDISPGDFNQDGTLDLAITGGESKVVTVVLGLGGGSFGFYASLSFVDEPSHVKAADLNEDGLDDIVASVPGDTTFEIGTVAVALNGGDRTFSFPQQYLAEWGTRGPVIGDFNGDGHQDIAVRNTRSRTISVWIGIGNGLLEPAIHILPSSVDDFLFDLAALDVDQDGLDDIAVSLKEAFSILLGSPGGVSSALPPVPLSGNGTNGNGITLGDADGNGTIDAIVSITDEDEVQIFLRDLNGVFLSPTTLAVAESPKTIRLADHDGDGLQDLILGHFNGGGGLPVGVSIHRGMSLGRFGPSIPLPGISGVRTIVVADLDGQFPLDGIAAPVFANTVAILLGSGSSFVVVDEPGAIDRPGPIVGADVDEDGITDIVVMDAGTRGVASFLATGVLDRSLPTWSQVNVTNNPEIRDSVAALLDGDSHIDLVAASDSNTLDGVVILGGQGNGRFEELDRHSLNQRTFALDVADFNEDGVLDLVALNNIGDSASILLGLGDGTFELVGTFVTGNSPRDVALGDFDGDQHVDAIVAEHQSVSLLRGDGAGGFSAPQPIASCSASSIDSTDLNHDQNVDVVVTRTSGLCVLLGDGGGGFLEIEIVLPGNVTTAAIADFSVDGNIDIALSSTVSESLFILEGDGTGNAELQRTVALAGPPQDLTANDIDGDGDPDLALSMGDLRSVSLLLNPAVTDCNVNGIPDECELAVDPGLDGNGNGVLDPCELEGFVRGDANGDGDIDGLTDALYILSHQFAGGPALPCLEAGDTNGDGSFDGLADGLYVLAHHFAGGPAPPAPYPFCGPDSDPTSSLGCAVGTCP